MGWIGYRLFFFSYSSRYFPFMSIGFRGVMTERKNGMLSMRGFGPVSLFFAFFLTIPLV